MHYSGSFSTRELTFHVLVLATQNTLHPKVGWLATGMTAYMLMHSIFNNNLIFSVNAKINEKKTTAGYTFLLEHITKWIADSMIHLHGMIWNSNAKRRHLKNTTSLFNWSGFCLHVNNSDVWGVFWGGIQPHSFSWIHLINIFIASDGRLVSMLVLLDLSTALNRIYLINSSL